MCGRIACGLKCDQICEISNAKNSEKNLDKYKSSYNVAPTTYIPIVYSKKQFKKVEKKVEEIDKIKVEEPIKAVEVVAQPNVNEPMGFGFNRRRNEVKVEFFTSNEEEEMKYNLERQQNVIYYSVLKEHEEPLNECISQEISFEPMKWGTTLGKYPVINIRQESLCFVPYYRQMLQRKNFCVTIVSGYFEWKEIAEGVKQPFYITSKDKYLILASLYDDFSEQEEKKVVIITQEANKCLSYVHSRMPVILNIDEMQKMIKATSIREYYSILNQVMKNNKDLDKNFLEYYPVGNLVNKLTNQDESVIISKNDVEKDKDGNFTLKAFFKKNKISLEDQKSNKMICLKSEEERIAEREIKKNLELFENVNNAKQLDKVLRKICIDSDIDEDENHRKSQMNNKKKNTQTLTQKFVNSKINVNSKRSQTKEINKDKSKSQGKDKGKTQGKSKVNSKSNERSHSNKSKDNDNDNNNDKSNRSKSNTNKSQKNKTNKTNKTQKSITKVNVNNTNKDKKSTGNLDSFVSSSKKSNSSKDL